MGALRILGLLALAVLASCGGGAEAPQPLGSKPIPLDALAAVAAASPDASPRLRGFHVAGEYYFANQAQLGNPTDAWLDYLQRTGVDWVGVSISMFSANLAEPSVYVQMRVPGEPPQFYRTFSDEQLTGFTRALHSRGIKVYWTLAFDQPQFDAGLGDPSFNPNPRNCGTALYNVPRYQFGDPDAPAHNRCIPASEWFWSPTHPQHAQKTARFFQSMTQVAARYGRLAQSLGVEMYSLGTETEWLWRTRSAVGSHFRVQLQAMVDSVREVYTGLLTYDQHLDAAKYRFGHDQYIPVFSDLGLDVVGVSYYSNEVPAEPNSVVSVETLKAGFLSDFDKYLTTMKAANGDRPVVLTEFGFVNSVNAAWNQSANLGEPAMGDSNGNGIFDGDEQMSNLLTAFAAAVDQRRGLLAGGFLWGQPVFLPSPEISQRIDFPVYGRAPETAVRQAYTAWAASQPAFPAPSNRSYECFFDWAETSFPTFFPPPGNPGAVGPLIYRQYSAAGAYLGAAPKELQLFYVGPLSSGELLRLGPVGDWLTRAGCPAR